MTMNKKETENHFQIAWGGDGIWDWRKIVNHRLSAVKGSGHSAYQLHSKESYISINVTPAITQPWWKLINYKICWNFQKHGCQIFPVKCASYDFSWSRSKRKVKFKPNL